ncbi:MAG: cytosine permease, partial [Pseudonocardia sp.]|nr:cytosine permease [Pseudonocardia sp.]
VMGVNAYGAMLTGTSAVDGFRPVRPTVRLRVVGLCAVGLVSVLIALLIPDDYLDSFNSFVVLMLYFLIPWTAVNLVDFYFVRHGEYAITEIFRPRGIYGRWSWRGMTAYLVGLVAMVPFFSTPFYVGPVASALDGADISFLVGLPVAGGLYYLFSRGIDQAAETEAVARSRRELEGEAVQS